MCCDCENQEIINYLAIAIIFSFIILTLSTYIVDVGFTSGKSPEIIKEMISNKSIECPVVLEAHESCGYTTLYCQRFKFLHLYAVSYCSNDQIRFENGFNKNVGFKNEFKLRDNKDS